MATKKERQLEKKLLPQSDTLYRKNVALKQNEEKFYAMTVYIKFSLSNMYLYANFYTNINNFEKWKAIFYYRSKHSDSVRKSLHSTYLT